MKKYCCYDNFLNSINTNDTYILKGIKSAVVRITEAVNKREKIVVYGSYDVDGITSVSLLILILKYLNADVEYYIPDTLEEKEIFNCYAIENHIRLLGASLIITVGCGINSLREVELCKKYNMDVIITDYHVPKDNIPKTIVINPKQEGCIYSFKELSAVGIAYKLAYSVAKEYQVKYIEKYLDLVAIGIISSGVPLVDENKRMVEKGIYYLANTNNYGIKALMKINNISDINYLSLFKIVHTIMPKVNAVGRMDDARIIVELFTTSDKERAERISKYIKMIRKYNF
ncbi:DHH family phosphoesterase [Clostridium sp. MB40-C1]|uniref:DHH family phosphoesterase n=1 Tax=Clostridium sp. MB40-C1 TaxID=3070996 RepID=UPI0027DF9D08|nr:DHH family phosphoesterase [Clostridium sp. MB40-C1]WMJ81270.1 DHH family phosphoesterase [Clostridium sp. MB40-C1]